MDKSYVNPNDKYTKLDYSYFMSSADSGNLLDEALVTDHFDKLYAMTELNSRETLIYLYPKEVEIKEDQDNDHWAEWYTEYMKDISKFEEIKSEKYYVKGNYFYDKETHKVVNAVNAEENFAVDGDYKYKDTEFYKNMPLEEQELCDAQVKGIVDVMNADYWFCYEYAINLDGSPYIPIKHWSEYKDWEDILTDKQFMTTNDFYAKYNFETHPKIFETVHMYYEKGSNYPKEKMDHRLKDRIWYFENYDHFKELTAARNASIPWSTLVYPEPFVASPSNIHHDPFFIHILLYQYWLWFFFITLIGFFFLSFAHAVRTDSVHNTPKKETRGVSRSRCGDCITFIVPVSWAVTIIISQSTDAADANDGHGTPEVVIGVRAFQWGWSYHFPRQPKLLHTESPDPQLLFAGNAIVIRKNPRILLADAFWNWAGLTGKSSINIPAHQLLLPIDSHKMVKFFNADDLGTSALVESTAFKKIRSFNKKNYFHMSLGEEASVRKFNELRELYLKDESTFDSYFYDVNRQHFMTTPSALLPQNNLLMDVNSINKSLDVLAQTKPFTSGQSDSTDCQPYYVWRDSVRDNDFSSSHNNTRITGSFKFALKSKYKYLNFDNKLMNYYLSLKEFSDLPILYSDKESLYLDVVKHPKFDLKAPLVLWDSSVDLDYKNPSIYDVDLDPKASSVGEKKRATASSIGLLNLRKSQIHNFTYNNVDSLNHSTYNSNCLFSETSDINDVSYIDNLFNINAHENSNHTPIKSSNHLSSSNFYISNSRKSKPTEDFEMLTYTKETAPESGLNNQNWDSIWINSSFDLRLYELLKLNVLKKNIYFPLSMDFVDYDFADATSAELLEDMFWESGYSAYTSDEIFYLFDNFISNKQDQPEWKENKSIHKPNLLSSHSLLSLLEDSNIYDSFSASYGSVNDSYADATLQEFVDSYTSAKESNIALSSIYSKAILDQASDSVVPNTHSATADEYSDSYDDFVWYSNEPWSNDRWNITSTQAEPGSENSDSADLPQTLGHYDRIKTTTGLIQNYIAVQKVLKSKFDNGQSNANTSLFFMAATPKTFINADESPYRDLIFKNFEKYVNASADKTTTNFLVNETTPSNNKNNTYFLDLPFLVGEVSDSSKFAWFDWYARWKSYEIQASSIARYSILGTPYFNKNFDFNLDKFTEIADSELYLTRVSRARRNYLASWTNTPYLYNRSLIKSLNVLGTNLSKDDFNSFPSTFRDLNISKEIWSSRTIKLNTYSYNINFTSSGLNSPSRFTSRPFYATTAASNYDSAVLPDLLSKRKALIVNYLAARNGAIDVDLLFDLAVLNMSDDELTQIIKSVKFNKDSLREGLNSVKRFVVKYENYLISGKKWRPLADHFLPMRTYYGLYCQTRINFQYEFDRFENFRRQHIQLRKGISNMNKLHATNVIALPVDSRIMVFASSKDIIHSWAIPAGGIKIDCVPGCTSHRIIDAKMVGIYTGQCMEICGRFHHWMPIVAYFLKKDLYYMWLYQAIARYHNESVPTIVYAIGLKRYMTTFSRCMWLNESYDPVTQLLEGEE